MKALLGFYSNIRVIAIIVFVSVFAKKAMSQNFNAINGYNGTIVIININTNKSSVYNRTLAKERTQLHVLRLKSGIPVFLDRV